MKKTVLVGVCLLLAAVAHADSWTSGYGQTRKANPAYQQDNYGHYTRTDNLYKDTDRDGVINKYDYNDNNPTVRTKPLTGSIPYGGANQLNSGSSRTKVRGY